ncbi:cytochrome b [Caulobacter sp. S45]|uniref:cytochrome b n=1 Tax=Caulobacter sp. S45 TaxID=1641861 RepID=UPI00131B4BC9|nr:cytochrome b/b6 domain-containing protein [Caulobacter sp. S45]
MRNTSDDLSGDYDPITIRLHWATAALIVVLWIMGRTTGWMPRGPLRVDVWSVHVLLGFALAVVLVARIAWRTTRGRRLPPVEHGVLHLVAKAVHGLLYVLLATVVVLGLINVFAHGFPMFNVLKFPKVGDKAFTKTVNHWHDLAANTIAAVALFHAIAALFHHYVRKNVVLIRMAPLFKRRFA